MGEEVRIAAGAGYGGGDDEDRMMDWEDGLPSADDLTPLSQHLIPPELMSAFRISPEIPRTMVDVNRASQTTISSLRGNNFEPFENGDDPDANLDGTECRKLRRVGSEEADSARTSSAKRPRLVWTPQLHKRFVEVVAHLGVNAAVPKTIMQLMNVDGLTRENVASHLQKYRLYLKRNEGGGGGGGGASSPEDQMVIARTSSGGGSGHSNWNNGQMGMPVPYPHQMVPMPVIGHSGHVGLPVGSYNGMSGFHHLQQYNGMEQHREWNGNN